MDLMTKFRLDGRVAIVTGSGRGIGKAIALAFAQMGAHIVVGEIDSQAGEATAQEIRSLGGKCSFVRTDGTDVHQVSGLVDATKSQYGRIDILVNNVGGIAPMTPVVNMAEERWDSLIRINLTSAFLCCKAVSRVMLNQRSGNIINIASASAIRPAPGMAAYAAAKAGLISFTQTLSIELASYHIRVNCIIPGAIETDLGTNLRGSSRDRVERAGIPVGRVGQPEDIALAAIYLAADASDYVTGTSILVNGGPYTRKGDVEMFVNKFPELLPKE
jgi:3-oxoacyl-[acyl-carrier protein] reductase